MKPAKKTHLKESLIPSGMAAASSPRPSRPRRVLVPLDFSVYSSQALRYARSFASRFKARIILIHVVEAFPIDHLLGLKSARQANEWLLEQSRDKLRQVARHFARPRSKVPDSLVTFGRPFHEIAKAAKERHADLIILATHGYTGLKHIQLGSTAERVVRHAPCPVLVVRRLGTSPPLAKRGHSGPQKAQSPTSAFKLKKILVPIDFSPRSRMALDYALPIARRFHARIVLLHVISDYAFPHPQLMDDFMRTGKTQLAAVVRSIPNRFEVTPLIKTGHPGYSIVDIADHLRVDLILIATHGRTGFKRALLGSTAEFVVRHAGCSVLTVRQVARGEK